MRRQLHDSPSLAKDLVSLKSTTLAARKHLDDMLALYGACPRYLEANRQVLELEEHIRKVLDEAQKTIRLVRILAQTEMHHQWDIVAERIDIYPDVVLGNTEDIVLEQTPVRNLAATGHRRGQFQCWSGVVDIKTSEQPREIIVWGWTDIGRIPHLFTNQRPPIS